MKIKNIIFMILLLMLLSTGCKKEPTAGAITLHEAVRKGDIV